MYLNQLARIIFSEKVHQSFYCLDTCSHYKYNSSIELVKKSIYALKILFGSKKQSNKTLFNMKELLYHNDDLCKTCTFVFLPQFYYQFNNLPKIPTVCSDGVDLGHFAIVSYPNLSKFVYRETSIWLYTIYNVLFCVTTIIGNSASAPPESMSMLFGSLRSMMHHIVLFRKKHWKIITFKCMFIIKLIEFIENELKQRIKSWKSGVIRENSTNCLQLLLIFMTKWLFYFNTFNKNSSNVIQVKKRLKQFRKTLESMSKTPKNKMDQQTVTLIQFFLLSLSLYKNWQNEINRNMLKLWRMRKYNQECLRAECNTKRKNKKWYKCSSCFVATYCSRKCAKRDWKYGYHKRYCAEYVQIKNDTKKYQIWKEKIKDLILVDMPHTFVYF